MGIENYLRSVWPAIVNGGQYNKHFFSSINPVVLHVMRPRTLLLIGAGAVLSVLTGRGLMPFLLLALLDADYKKFKPELMWIGVLLTIIAAGYIVMTSV